MIRTIKKDFKMDKENPHQGQKLAHNVYDEFDSWFFDIYVKDG